LPKSFAGIDKECHTVMALVNLLVFAI
jgi:hypothetical protein